MSTELYPKASIAMGNGDLLDVYNVELTITANKKVIHTLRRDAAGIFKGPVEATVSFSSKIGKNGEELDYLEMVRNHVIKSLRLKLPNRTVTIEGEYGEVKYSSGNDDAIDLSTTFSGGVV